MRELIQGQLSSYKSLKKFRSLVDGRWKTIKKARLEIIRKIKPVKRGPIQRFYQDQLQRISRSLNGVISDGRLHVIRKQIKGLLYNYKPFCDILNMHLNTGYLEQVEEAIGKWHDQLMIRQLSGKYQNMIRRSEEDCLANLRSDITRLINNFYQRTLFMTDNI
ncbi:hypothetical protein OQX61_13930 [Pedobacter sp. PLR]|uniref:hypothetical protein n=1 Tax=Pedobacter sp. PLR TaxID=2994465 RepID=UPI00224789A5|nr:hypothetical protein [Pedobacter sp. PLR]MCX2452369.1 hypothetical protein [Pedobacter sp. PLR]